MPAVQDRLASSPGADNTTSGAITAAGMKISAPWANSQAVEIYGSTPDTHPAWLYDDESVGKGLAGKGGDLLEDNALSSARR